MEITITARHFDLTNAIRDHIELSSERLDRYFDQVMNIHFILSLENEQSHVEMILHAPRNIFRSDSFDKDMYLAIDTAIDKMEAQVRKLKDKWSDHQKKSLKKSTEFVYANLIERAGDRHRINVKRVPPELMTINEAIDKIESEDEFFLIFRDVDTDKVSVLVRKDEQHYKLFANM
ncbi:MAG: ribosome-associated translation inhibitor RaiA [Candidatus Cloacimonetes bacterium]|nr:ribosome-associated translation inhibitor RaiA [Candidatus Cloacimonadota bacterium]